MTTVERSPCPVCGSLNDATATECAECGLTLRFSESPPAIDRILDEITAAPGAKADPAAANVEEVAKTDVDDHGENHPVAEGPESGAGGRPEGGTEQFECPMCATPVSADMETCPNCGAIFEDVAGEPTVAQPTLEAGSTLAELSGEAKSIPAEPSVRPAPTAVANPPTDETRPQKEIASRLMDSGVRSLPLLSGRFMDIVVIATVAALAAVFFVFRMYSFAEIERNPASIAVFVAVAAGGFGGGFALFHLSTSAIAQGDRLVKQGRCEEAIRLYDRAIRTGYRRGSAWASKGVALKRLERFEDAMRCQQTALQLDPKNEIAWCNLGDLHFHRGDSAESISCYDKAIAVRPRYAIAWNNKGAVLAREGRYEEARVCHDRAVTLQPKYRAAWLNRGEVLARLGFLEEAQKCLEQARALSG